MFDLIGQYFWVICLVFSALPLLSVERRVAETVAQKPYEAEQVRNIYRMGIFASMVPWLVVDAGHLSGSTPAMWYYFRPQDMNPFVLAFLATIFLYALLAAYWVLFRNGARIAVDLKLVEAISFGTNSTPSERIVKLIAACGPLFVIAWIMLVISMDAKLPGKP